MSTRWYHIIGLLLLGYLLGWWMPKWGNMLGVNKILTPMN